MKILVITPGFLPAIGGAEIGVHEIYSRLGKKHQVTILTAFPKNSRPLYGFDQTHYTIRHYRDRLNFGRIGGRMLLGGSIPPFSIGALIGAIKTIREDHPDVVNVHYAAYTGLAAIWAQKRAGIPTVLSLIGRDSAPGPHIPRLWPWYSSLVARRVDHTIFISEFCRSFFRGLPISQSTIRYGADIEKIQPHQADSALRAQLGLATGTRVLFSLQRLSPLKHVEVAIHSVKLLLDQGVENIVLLIGGTGRDESRLNQLVVSLSLQPYVKFLGFIPESSVQNYFSLAEIFVFPSFFETFGIVLAQAMAAGKPITASNFSAIPELVQDGITGLLSPPLDHRALAENIRRLLEDQNLRERMGRIARQQAMKQFNWDLVAQRYEQVLKQTAERKSKVQLG